MDDFGSVLGYAAVIGVMALMIYAVVVFELRPRRRAVDQANVMMDQTAREAFIEQQSRLAVATTPSQQRLRSSPPEPSFDPRPTDNDIPPVRQCANCERSFHENDHGVVWTNSETTGHRVWYCSTACANSMPFLPDPDAQAYARHIRMAIEREYPGRSSSVYTEAIRLRRQAEQQIRLERMRIDAEMLRMREPYGVNHPPRSRPGRVRRPIHFTGQEPEDL